MALSIIVHGVTTGFDTSESNSPTFIQNFYNLTKGENYFIAEIRRDGTRVMSCYTLYISRNVSNSGNRPGSYFAISVIYDDYVCLDVKAISSALETTFRNAIVGIVLKKQDEGYRYLVGNFAALKPQIDDALNKLYGQIFNVLQGRQQIDNSFSMKPGQLSKWNPTDLKDSEIYEIIRREGGIKLSNEFPSQAHKRKLEEERRQRQLEAEMARRKLEEQKALAERILAEERERAKRELIKIADEAKANVERLRRENEANIRAEVERTSKEIASLKSEIAEKETVIREYNREYEKLADAIAELNRRMGDSQCSTYQTFSVEINRLTEGVRRSYQSYGDDIKRLSADVESLRQRVDGIKSGDTGPVPPPIPPRPKPIPKKLIIGIFGVLVALIVTVLLLANRSTGDYPISNDEYVHYAYANSLNGADFSVEKFAEAKYMGTYRGPEKEQPLDYYNYKWEKIESGPEPGPVPTDEEEEGNAAENERLTKIQENAPKFRIDISDKLADGKRTVLLMLKNDSVDDQNFLGRLKEESFEFKCTHPDSRTISQDGNGVGVEFIVDNDVIKIVTQVDRNGETTKTIHSNIEMKYSFGTFKRNGITQSFEINNEYQGDN